MQINEKKNKSLNDPKFNDKDISRDFSKIFDLSENDDLGKIFLNARVKKGLTQEQASKILKVRVSSIKKIEKGEELDIIGITYQVGFIRSYSKLVDLDPEYIIQIYKSTKFKDPEKFNYNFPGIGKEKKSLIPALSLLSFLLALVVYSSWYYLNLNDLEEQNKKISNEIVEDYNLNYVKIEEKKISVNRNKEVFSSSPKINDKNPIKLANDNALIKNKLVDEKGNKKNNLKIVENTSETSAVANERIPKEEMVLKSVGNSWVEIEDLDGKSYLTRLMRAGETFVIPMKKGLTLSTGNAGVLSLTLGSIHVSKLGEIGEVISSRPLNIEAFRTR